MDFMFENYEYRQNYVDNLLGRLLSTSILTVLLVLLLGAFEILFFRRFFLYKKLIWKIINYIMILKLNSKNINKHIN